jgi:hypothetical protein
MLVSWWDDRWTLHPSNRSVHTGDYSMVYTTNQGRETSGYNVELVWFRLLSGFNQLAISDKNINFSVHAGCMVLNATFNNISVTSWWSVLLVEETGVPGENHQPVACHWQTFSYNVLSSTLCQIQLPYDHDHEGPLSVHGYLTEWKITFQQGIDIFREKNWKTRWHNSYKNRWFYNLI